MIVYLAHPVGFDPEQRKRNLENVKEWFKWLIDHTDWTINVSWYIYVTCLDEVHRSRGIRDDLRIANTCDAIALTGGKISSGMEQEEGIIMCKNGRIFDFTELGFEAPKTPEATARALEIINS